MPVPDGVVEGREHLASVVAEGIASLMEQPGRELVKAAARGKTDVVKRLLAWGDDPNQDDGSRFTAAAHAVLGGHAKALELLLKKGAAADGDEVHVAPVLIAALGGRVDCLKVLIEAGADISSQPFVCYAAGNGYPDACRALVAAGANVDSREPKVRLTGAAVACRHGDVATLRALIDCGADVDARNKNGSSLVFLASQLTPGTAPGSAPGSLDCLRALIEAGADVDVPRNTGATPCYIAASDGKRSSLELLIEAGCDVKKPTDDGETPSDIAARQGHRACLDALLAAGAPLPADWSCGDAKPENVSYQLGEGFAMVMVNRAPDDDAASDDTA